MNDKVNDLITGLGAIAEVCGELYRQFIRNGFTEVQSMQLVERYLTVIVTPRQNKEEN
jgi:hypothetical protein